MTLDPATVLVAIALLTTHPQQPKGREIAADLQALYDQLPRERTEP